VLQREWASLFTTEAQRVRQVPYVISGRLPRGLRTPEEAFRQPILEALVELGGKAPMRKVLDVVEKKVRSKLNKYDLEALPSDPKSVRWRNTAQWCRNTLVEEGLMRRDSPYGIWEISELGRKALQEGNV